MTDSEAASQTEPFNIGFSLPVGWRYVVTDSSSELYSDGFLPSINILDENANVMGAMAFTKLGLSFYSFTDDESYKSTVCKEYMLSVLSDWDNGYTPVRSDRYSESAVTSVRVRDAATGEETSYPAVLSYNVNIPAYVAIRFKEDAVTDEELKTIAESIYLTNENVYTDEIALFRNYLITHYTYAFMRTSENMLPPSGYTDSSDLKSYMSLCLEYDTYLYSDGRHTLKDIAIIDRDIRRGKTEGGTSWALIPYEITYNVLELNSDQVMRGNAYFEYYINGDDGIRISSCYLGSDGDVCAFGRLDGEPPYKFDYKAGAEKLSSAMFASPEQLFASYLYRYYYAVFYDGTVYDSFDTGRYTDSHDLKTYLQLKMAYDLDAYERYSLINIKVSEECADEGVKEDGTKWMTVPCELIYTDKWDGDKSGWGGNAYFEYTDENGYVSITAVADGSAGSVYAIDTLSQGSPPYDIYIKDGTEKLLNSPAVGRLASSSWVDEIYTGVYPQYLEDVCEPYLYDYWNYIFKLGDFEPADYISDPDMLDYANAVKYRYTDTESRGLRELNGIIFRGVDFGSVSETRDWVMWKYDLGLVIDDVSQIYPDAYTGYSAYFEVDKTDGGYEIYRAFSSMELTDFGLPTEPLSFPLPSFDLKAAAQDILNTEKH